MVLKKSLLVTSLLIAATHVAAAPTFEVSPPADGTDIAQAISLKTTKAAAGNATVYSIAPSDVEKPDSEDSLEAAVPAPVIQSVEPSEKLADYIPAPGIQPLRQALAQPLALVDYVPAPGIQPVPQVSKLADYVPATGIQPVTQPQELAEYVPAPGIAPLPEVSFETTASVVTVYKVDERLKRAVASLPTFDERTAENLEIHISKSASQGDKLTRKDHAALGEYYAERDFMPVWFKDGNPTQEALALIDRLAEADADGLTAADYPTLIPHENAPHSVVAAAEFLLSESLLHYARDAQAGRIDPAKVSRSIKLRPVRPDPLAVMAEVVDSANPAETLALYNPQHRGFKALKAELARLRSLKDPMPDVHFVRIPHGKMLREGSRGNRVSLLRERLNVPALAGEEDNRFDAPLERAVRAFQSENGLIADGLVGPQTLAVLNKEPDGVNRIPDLIANMESWRWMARDLGDFHIIANIPAFDVTIVKNGENIHRTRVVVGKPRHKTPVFSDTMEFVVVNPYWNVPYSIASKELLPSILRNPGYVYAKNYEVLRGNRVVNPSSVNWHSGSFRKYRIRQRPGRGNALGAVKFLFPNKYSVYFHDTPSKSLFQRASRAFSHGCVRIHNPFEFGDVIMQHAMGWRPGSLEDRRGPREKWIKLPKKNGVSVHLAYFTAVSDSTGKVTYKGDVYGHNTRLKQALGLI